MKRGATGAEELPGDFGREGGTPISNKATVLDEIDRALGRDSPPDVEVLLTQVSSSLPLEIHTTTTTVVLNFFNKQ